MEAMEYIDKEKLIEKLVKELPDIKERLAITNDDLEDMTNIGAKRIAAFEEGRQEMKWSEYLSIVFVLWSNDVSKGILDEKGLFPPEMRRAFSVNKNAHRN